MVWEKWGGDLMEQRKLREGWMKCGYKRHGTYIYYSQCPANGSISDPRFNMII